MRTKSKLQPTLAALAAVLLFSTGGLSIKWISLSGLPISGFRSLLAAVFFGFYLKRFHNQSLFPRITRYGIMAALGYLVMTVSYVLSMKMTTAANAIFIQYTMPAWVLIGGALWLHESITWGRVATIVLSFAGMMFFFMDELSPQQWQGNLVALLSGIGYAVVILALRKDRKQNPMGAVFWGNALTALIVIPLAFSWIPNLAGQLADLQSWFVLLWLGLFQIGLAYIFFVSALKHLPAIEVALLTLVEPVLNPFWVYIVLGERPSHWAYLGGSLILIAVFSRAFLRENEKE